MTRGKTTPLKQTAQRATLYLLVGYPGSGKTTTSQIIHDLTGAVHIWADYERQAMFSRPSHGAKESHQLYEHLNKATELLLSDGQSVIFDTNFNFRRDRDLLRSIAAAHNATAVIVWIKVAKNIARSRATKLAHLQDTRLLGDMTHRDFDRITGNLESPAADEQAVVLDGMIITPTYVAAQLGLKLPPVPKVASTRSD